MSLMALEDRPTGKCQRGSMNSESQATIPPSPIVQVFQPLRAPVDRVAAPVRLIADKFPLVVATRARITSQAQCSAASRSEPRLMYSGVNGILIMYKSHTLLNPVTNKGFITTYDSESPWARGPSTAPEYGRDLARLQHIKASRHMMRYRKPGIS